MASSTLPQSQRRHCQSCCSSSSKSCQSSSRSRDGSSRSSTRRPRRRTIKETSFARRATALTLLLSTLALANQSSLFAQALDAVAAENATQHSRFKVHHHRHHQGHNQDHQDVQYHEGLAGHHHNHHGDHERGLSHSRRDDQCGIDNYLVSVVLVGDKQSLSRWVHRGDPLISSKEVFEAVPDSCRKQWLDKPHCCTANFFEEVARLHRTELEGMDSIKDTYEHVVQDVLNPALAELKNTNGAAQTEHISEAIRYVSGHKQATIKLGDSLLQRRSLSHQLHRHRRLHRSRSLSQDQPSSVAALVRTYLDRCEKTILHHFTAMTCKICDPSISDFLADRFMQVHSKSIKALWAKCKDMPLFLLQAASQLKEAKRAVEKIRKSHELGTDSSLGTPSLLRASWRLGAAAQQVEQVADRISFYGDEASFRDRLSRSGYAYRSEDWGFVDAMHPSQAVSYLPLGKSSSSCVNGQVRGERCVCKPCWEGPDCSTPSPGGPMAPQPFSPLTPDRHVLRVVGCQMVSDENSQFARIRLVAKAARRAGGDPCQEPLSFTSEDDLKYQVPMMATDRLFTYDIRKKLAAGAYTVCFCFGSQCWKETETWHQLGEVAVVQTEEERHRVEVELSAGKYPSFQPSSSVKRCPLEPLLNHDLTVEMTRSWHNEVGSFTQETFFFCSEGFRNLEGPPQLMCANGVWTVKETVSRDKDDDDEDDDVDGGVAKTPLPKPDEGGKAEGPKEGSSVLGVSGVDGEGGLVYKPWDGVLPTCYALTPCSELKFPQAKGFTRILENGIVTYRCDDHGKIVVIPSSGISRKVGALGVLERVRPRGEEHAPIYHVMDDLGSKVKVHEVDKPIPKDDLDWLTSFSDHSWFCQGHETIEVACETPPPEYFEEVTTEEGRSSITIQTAHERAGGDEALQNDGRTAKNKENNKEKQSSEGDSKPGGVDVGKGKGKEKSEENSTDSATETDLHKEKATAPVDAKDTKPSENNLPAAEESGEQTSKEKEPKVTTKEETKEEEEEENNEEEEEEEPQQAQDHQSSNKEDASEPLSLASGKKDGHPSLLEQLAGMDLGDGDDRKLQSGHHRHLQKHRRARHGGHHHHHRSENKDGRQRNVTYDIGADGDVGPAPMSFLELSSSTSESEGADYAYLVGGSTAAHRGTTHAAGHAAHSKQSSVASASSATGHLHGRTAQSPHSPWLGRGLMESDGRLMVVLPQKRHAEEMRVAKFPVQFTLDDSSFHIDQCWVSPCGDELSEVLAMESKAEREEQEELEQTSLTVRIEQELFGRLVSMPHFDLFRILGCGAATLALLVWMLPGLSCCTAPAGKDGQPSCCFGRAKARSSLPAPVKQPGQYIGKDLPFFPESSRPLSFPAASSIHAPQQAQQVQAQAPHPVQVQVPSQGQGQGQAPSQSQCHAQGQGQGPIPVHVQGHVQGQGQCHPPSQPAHHGGHGHGHGHSNTPSQLAPGAAGAAATSA